MEHTMATTSLPRSYCKTYSGYLKEGFLFSNRTAPRRIKHATPSLSWSKGCQTSFLQHCGHQIHRIWTQSTIASGVYCRRKFTDPELLRSTNLKRVWSTSAWARFDHVVDRAHGCCYRPVASSQRLCPCERSTLRAQILTVAAIYFQLFGY